MNLLKVKSIISGSMGLFFFVSLLTGLGLWLSPSGRIARDTGWSLAGISKFSLEYWHTLSSFLFAVLAMTHFTLNFKLWLSEIKLWQKIKK